MLNNVFRKFRCFSLVVLLVLSRSASENLLKFFRLKLFAFIEEFFFRSKKNIFFFTFVEISVALRENENTTIIIT